MMAKQINDHLLYHDELLNAHQQIRKLEEEKRQQAPIELLNARWTAYRKPPGAHLAVSIKVETQKIV